MSSISEKTVGRLCQYRRYLTELAADGVSSVYSHQIASCTGGSSAQVRRDIMALGYSGSPTKGYIVADLAESIAEYLDAPEGQRVALVGIGNLGRALLAFFANRRPRLSIVAAFDSDASKAGRVIHGCRCYADYDMARVIEKERVAIGIIAVPVEAARRVADDLVAAGVRGLLNFAPAPLEAPKHVYVEDIDVTMSLEKVAFFSRRNAEAGRPATADGSS